MKISEEIQEFLKTNQEDIEYQKYSMPKTRQINDMGQKSSESAIDVIMDYADAMFYKTLEFYNNRNIGVSPAGRNLLSEAIKNSNFYSDSDTSPLEVELFLSEKGFVSRFCDGGSYFSREDIKNYWESRERPPESQTKDKEYGIGNGAGMNIIYPLSDFIYVDNSEKKLYLGISRNNNQVFNDCLLESSKKLAKFGLEKPEDIPRIKKES